MNRYAALCAAGAALALAALGTAAVPAHADPRPAMAWSGDVDDTTLVYFHGRDVRTRDVSGKASTQTSAQVFDRLPRGPVRVFLTERAGRGSGARRAAARPPATTSPPPSASTTRSRAAPTTTSPSPGHPWLRPPAASVTAAASVAAGFSGGPSAAPTAATTATGGRNPGNV